MTTNVKQKIRDAEGEEYKMQYLNLEGPIAEIRMITGIGGSVTRTFLIHKCLLSEDLDLRQDKGNSTFYINMYNKLEKRIMVYLSWIYTQKLPINPSESISWVQFFDWGEIALLFKDRKFQQLLFQNAIEKALQVSDTKDAISAYLEIEDLKLQARVSGHFEALHNFLVDYYITNRSLLTLISLETWEYEAILDRLFGLRDKSKSFIDMSRYDGTVERVALASWFKADGKKEDCEIELKRECASLTEMVNYLNDDMDQLKLIEEAAISRRP